MHTNNFVERESADIVGAAAAFGVRTESSIRGGGQRGRGREAARAAELAEQTAEYRRA